ncbi:TSUP family transporter [Geotalea uraniireducens]|uniref:TSUP family transporter n=1 Tax=Geotalea uraniireducens TaxID=351604 RepID=UPI003898E0A0
MSASWLVSSARGGFHHPSPLIHAFKVPVRTAIGTSAAVAFLSALAGFLGKGTGPVPLLWGIAVSFGALLGGQMGGMLSHRLSTITLRRILFLVVAISAVRIFVQALL